MTFTGYSPTVLVVEEGECLSIDGCQWKDGTCVNTVSPEKAHPMCRDAKDYCSCVLKTLILSEDPVRVPTALSKQRCAVVKDCIWDLFECRLDPYTKWVKSKCYKLDEHQGYFIDEENYCGCSLKVQLERDNAAKMRITV